MQQKIELSVEDGIAYAQMSAFWDGFAAGVTAAAEHAKQAALQGLLNARQQKGPQIVATKEEA